MNITLNKKLNNLKIENDELNLELIKLKHTCKELSRDNEEYRKVLNDKEGYQTLEDTVT